METSMHKYTRGLNSPNYQLCLLITNCILINYSKFISQEPKGTSTTSLKYRVKSFLNLGSNISIPNLEIKNSLCSMVL